MLCITCGGDPELRVNSGDLLCRLNLLCTTTARWQKSQGFKVTFPDPPVSLSVPAQCRESSLPTKSFGEIC